MELLAPSALWWLAALALLLLLPRLRRPVARVPVATLRFWREARAEQAARPFIRLRRHLRLLIQAAAILAMVFALARPLLLSGAREQTIVIDLSASMAASDGGGTRLDRAREAVRGIAGGLPFGSRVTLVAAGPVVDAYGPFSARGGELSSALAGLKPGEGLADLDAAIRTARTLGRGDLILLTDASSAPQHPDVRIVPVGAAADNVAIGLFAVRRLPASPLDAEAITAITNYGIVPAAFTLSIGASETTLHAEAVILAPGATHRIRLLVPATRGALVAAIDVTDALAIDNRRVVSLPPPVRAALTGNVSEFLRKALEANPDVAIAAGGEAADVLVCGGCAEAPSGPVPVMLVPPAGAVREPLKVEHVGRRIMRLDADAHDERAVRDARFPVLVAEAVSWLAARDTPVDGRFPASESNLRPLPEASAVNSAGVAARGRTPLAATLFLLAAALVALEWFLAPRQGGQRRGAMILRGATLTALLLGAAGVTLPIGEGPASVVFAIDRSASMPAEAQRAAAQRVQEFTSAMRSGDRAAVVGFGGEVTVERPLAQTPPAPPAPGRPAGGTNIAAALRAGRAILNAAGTRRIVLVTDGRGTDGDALAEAKAAAAAGIIIDAVALGGGRAQASIAEVLAPRQVRSGDRFDVSVAIDAPRRSSTAVTLFRDGSAVHSATVTADESGRGSLVFADTIRGDSVVTYTALTGADPMPELARIGTAVIATGAPLVLYVSPHRPAAAESGLALEHRLPAALTATTSLSRYHAVVLDDVDAGNVGEGSARALREYVKGGGGLLLRGGESVLGPAGYPQLELDAALPVDLRGRGGSRAPDVAFVVAFDKSGSMADAAGGTTKIEIARRAVLAVRDMLPDGDAMGVIAFDAEPSIAAPLTEPVTAAALRATLAAIAPRGPTRIAPAIELARQWLDKSPAARKHILLISDGESNDEDASAVEALLQDGRTELTIVAAGGDSARGFFTRLASRTNGRVFFPADVASLPSIVAREAARTNGGWRVRERFTPNLDGHHPIAGAVNGSLPALDRYVAGSLRQGAEAVLTSHLGDPVLAAGRHGLGRVVMMTTDGPAADPQQVFARVWTEAIRWASAGRAGTPLRLEILAHAGGADLAIDAVERDGTFLDGYTGEAAVRSPSGEVRRFPLEQTAPGRYAAGAAFLERGTHLVSVSLRSADGGAEQATRQAVYWSAPAEQVHEHPDVEQLSRIVQAGGGQLIPAHGAGPFAVARERRARDLTGALGIIALLLFMLDVAARRGVFHLWRRPRAVVQPA